MTEHAFSYPKIDRRGFLTRAGIALGGATITGIGAHVAANPPHASWLKPITAGDRRIGQLKRLRSARVAERTFGPLDWSAVRSASLHGNGATLLDDQRLYYVPIQTRGETSTLLVLSNPDPSGALTTAAARSGDRSLFNDDVVVQLSRRGEPELRWSTVDGRTIVSRHATGEQRLSMGAAGRKLARGVGHPSLALAAGIAACGDAGADLRGGERLPLALYRAGASGKRRIRSCSAPLTRR